MTNALKKIGIIGAGQMGSGIAHVCALAGYEVVLNDVSADRIKSGLATINGNMARQVSLGEDHRGRSPGGAQAHRARAETTTGSPTATWSSRRRPRTRRSSARSSRASAAR